MLVHVALSSNIRIMGKIISLGITLPVLTIKNNI